METSQKEICWGLVLVICTKSLANLSLASVAQGRIISRKGGNARAEELIKIACSQADRKSNGQTNTNRWTQGALRKQERKTDKLRRGKDKDLQRKQRTGKRWTDTQIAGHTDRKKNKKKTEEQIDKNKRAMSQADRGRGNQLNNHTHN